MYNDYRKLEQEEYSSEEEPAEKVRTVKRRKVGFVPTERSDSELPPWPDQQSRNHTLVEDKVRTPPASMPVSGGLWTDDDLAELIQLVKKYPGGTTERWERIGDAMNRYT